MIQAEDLRKSYGALKAVDGVSFKLEPGETFGLLGPNGAGKSTTIHMLVGILKPDSGHVQINGDRDPTRAGVRRNVGMAPQDVSLYDALTAAENLSFLGNLYGLSGKPLRDRVEWALDFAGLTDRRKDRVSTFSGGMKRRLNLAAALIHAPPALLCDEPTAGVDPQSRNRLFESIEALKAEGRTILYTTHYMEEAQRLCDRVAIMDHGRVLALDTVDALIATHGGASVVTAELTQPPADLSTLGGTLDQNMLRIDTAQPLEEISRLAAAGVKFSRLHVERPDLESVFLALTGRSLRD